MRYFWADRSTMSGMESDHVAMIALYQADEGEEGTKPNVAAMNLEQYSVLPDKLPCQEVPPFPKPILKPSLPSTFKVADKINA